VFENGLKGVVTHRVPYPTQADTREATGAFAQAAAGGSPPEIPFQTVPKPKLKPVPSVGESAVGAGAKGDGDAGLHARVPEEGRDDS